MRNYFFDVSIRALLRVHLVAVPGTAPRIFFVVCFFMKSRMIVYLFNRESTHTRAHEKKLPRQFNLYLETAMRCLTQTQIKN